MKRLPRVKRRIFEVISACPGITAAELTSRVYEDDPNGGPESIKCVHVHVHALNKRLAAEGLRIRGHVTDGYRIERHDNETSQSQPLASALPELA